MKRPRIVAGDAEHARADGLLRLACDGCGIICRTACAHNLDLPALWSCDCSHPKDRCRALLLCDACHEKHRCPKRQ
jgi:hypothetical protein